ncbi:chemosensory receptor C [Elysia marginata]|uniref:Chemosensory receptor C n=1 Tax=Elysia marginata TaxID=1093978 RepID=A0AAV4FKS7_9GAST|nr:chemosensory receptor C [Elysia marginata]
MTNLTDTPGEELPLFYQELQVLQLFLYDIWACTLLFGLVSNTLNITVFLKIGFKDNVTVSLLFLSISDLITLILNTPTIVVWFTHQHFPNHEWPFHASVLRTTFYWYGQIFYDFSSFTSVFLGLVRCACVARPLLFKSMFTITRTLIILGVLFLAALSLRAPVLSIFRIDWVPKPQTNTTWLSIVYTPNFAQVFTASDVINRNIVSWVAYIIAVACVIVLVTKLLAASRFRQSLASQTAMAHGPKNKKKTVPSSNDNSTSIRDTVKSVKESNSQNEKTSNKLSAKDLQVIQSVTLICAIFIFSQLPFQFNSTMRLVDPEMMPGRRKAYVYAYGSQIAFTFSYLNASINILVHYNFNSRYRETFLSLFSRKSA